MDIPRNAHGGRTVLLASANEQMSFARMPQLFADAGIRVAVMAPAHNPAFGSGHVAERWPVPVHVPTVRRRLRALLRERADAYDRVIVCDEDLIAAISRHRDEAWASRCLPVPLDVAPMVSSKAAFIAACQDAGIAVPASRVCVDAAGAHDAACRIGYPVVVKADFGASGCTVWRVDDDRSLLAVLHRTAGRPFVVQQYWDDAVAGVTEMLCAEGRVLAIVSSDMRGIDPPPFGPSSSRLYRRNHAAEAVAGRLAALTRFDGLCGFDWLQREGPDGPVAALEFHARPTLGFHMADRAGVDFAAAIRVWLDGGSHRAAAQADADVIALYFPKDLTRAVRRRDWRGLARWLPGACANDLPWRDPGLLLAIVRRALRTRLPQSARVAGPSVLHSTLAHSTAFGDEP